MADDKKPSDKTPSVKKTSGKTPEETLAELEAQVNQERQQSAAAAASTDSKKDRAAATQSKADDTTNTDVKPGGKTTSKSSDKTAASAPSKNVTARPTSEKVRSTRPTAPDDAPSRPVKTKGLWFFTLLNLLLVLAIMAGGYWFWQQWQQYQQNQNTALETQNAALQEQSRTVELQQQSARQVREIEAQVEQFEAQQQRLRERADEQLTQLRQALETQSAKLNDMKGRRPSDWLIAEADYLVRMAGRKLWLEKDISTAILMLQSADSRIQDTADPSLIPLRQLISDDIQTLRQINPVSLTSVALAIAALSKQVDDLPIALPKLPELNQQTREVTDDVDDWQKNLLSQWHYFVENLINYQPRSTPIRPMLSEDQQWWVRQQLRLTLQQAQIAVQQEQPALFHQSLQNAVDLILSHYDTEAPAVAQFAKSLQNLINTDISREYPVKFKSVQPLRDALEERVNQAFSNRGEVL